METVVSSKGFDDTLVKTNEYISVYVIHCPLD